MTASQVYDLAFRYIEEYYTNHDLKPDMFRYAQKYFLDAGGSEEDYNVYIDLVYAFLKCKVELQLSDIYLNESLFRNANTFDI